MRRLYLLLDSAITWIERIQQSKWGRYMLSVVAGVFLWAWALFVRLPSPIAFMLAMAAFALTLAILYYAPRILARLSPFPFCVTVRTIAVSNQSFQAHVLILNRRAINMVITLRICRKSTPDDPGHWYQTFEMDQLRDSLGPHEKTEGVVRIVDSKKEIPKGTWFLSVADMVSG